MKFTINWRLSVEAIDGKYIYNRPFQEYLTGFCERFPTHLHYFLIYFLEHRSVNGVSPRKERHLIIRLQIEAKQTGLQVAKADNPIDL